MVDLRKLDLNLLVIFEAIYSAGNISRAARQLGVSQPTISNALTRLRDALDDQLFVRAGQGVEPTPKALEMIGPVREALQMIRSGVGDGDAFDPATTRRTFRLVLLDPLEPILMPPLIRQIQDYQSITLETLPVGATPVMAGLSDGSLDLVLSTFVSNDPDIESETIGKADVVVVARKGHPKINGKFTRENFEQIGHVALDPKLRSLSRVDETLQHHQIRRHIVYTVTKFWSFPHIIANTDLIALLPGDFSAVAAQHYPLELHPLPFEIAEQQLYMTWKSGRANDPGHRWLREQVLDAYQQSTL